ncbi:MAG: hypothetical protein H7222_15600 [Methylotenera sp.]|nr:hypothetical protein [Oligoflexia bacterium]
MSIWIIISWVCVAILTAVNIVVFLKLKGASEQMLKMAFPGAKDMGAALQQMQQMMGGMGGAGMGGMGGMGGMPNMKGRGGMPTGLPMGGSKAGKGSKQDADAQLKAAMNMLENMKKGNKR